MPHVPDLPQVEADLPGSIRNKQWRELQLMKTESFQKWPPTKDNSLPQEPDLNDATKAQPDPLYSHGGREKYRSTMPKLDRTMVDVYTDKLYSPSFHITLASSSFTPPPTTKANHHRESSRSSLGSVGIESPFTPAAEQQLLGDFHHFLHDQNPPSKLLTAEHSSPEHSLAPQFSNPWPKTISPKDVDLIYHESEEEANTPLFLSHKINPQHLKYRPQLAISQEPSESDDHVSHRSYGSMARTRRESLSAYSTSSYTTPQLGNFNFAPPVVPGSVRQIPQQYPFVPQSRHRLRRSNIWGFSEDFTPTLTLMESSSSEYAPKTFEVKKPAGTSIDTGTYTCTYHGCASRFDTPAKLQRHKREGHRSSASVEVPVLNASSKIWSALSYIRGRTYSRATNFKRKAIEVVLNGVSCLARPDSGSDRNIMTEDCAKECGVPIMRGENDKGLFKLGTGKYISSIGRAYVPLSLLGDNTSKEYCWFDVLAKCPVPLIIGLGFVRKIQLYTKNKHLLVESPFNFSLPTLKWIGTPKGRVEFMADGKTLIGGVDTGSDLDFMSLGCARRHGFKIDRRESARTRVMLPDQTIVETIGQVHVSSLQISGFVSFEMIFHVLPGLSCDVIFGEEFLEQMDAFNACDILDDDADPSIYSLHTLINLGPIQSFLARKGWTKTLTPEEDSLLLEHDAGIEAEIYRRNKANRAISKIKNRARAEAAREEEEVKSRRFDRGHENCVHCSVNDPRSELSST